MDWAQVLVIILAVMLAVFLTLAIILTVLLVKLTRQIKNVASSAERTIHTLENSASRLRKGFMPVVVLRSFMKRGNKSKRETRKQDH